MERTYSIPVAVTVSRRTGEITDVEYRDVKEEDFRRFCQRLVGRGRGSGKGAVRIRAEDDQGVTT